LIHVGKVTSLHMPQRAYERKLEIILPHLAKQKGKRLRETRERERERDGNIKYKINVWGRKGERSWKPREEPKYDTRTSRESLLV